MDQSNLKAADHAFIANTYNRFDVVLDHGTGAQLYDAEGREYIDFGAGIAVNTFGANDPDIAAAVTAQMAKLSHASNLYFTAPQVELAQKLCTRTGLKKVFFCNSGAEANECAIKVARKYSFDKYGKGRNEIVTLINSFHGRTVTTLSATGQDVFHNHFFPFTEGFTYAVANDFDALTAAVTDKTCAVLLEPVQGEGGVTALDDTYLRRVEAFCRARDILVMLDEVQTGNGRTGALYAYMTTGLDPDVVTTAKGLAGGLPFGACMLGASVQDVLTASTHGSTFGGNPVCCAAANVVLDKLTDEFLAQVREKATYFRTKLADIGIKDVSGKGLMLGAVVEDASAVAKRCLHNGLLVLTAKTKLRFLPPLNITHAQIDRGVEILMNCLV